MYERRSLFFPLALIAAGVLWLMSNMGVLPAANFWALTQVWPYLLIAGGISLIVRAYWPEGGAAMSGLVVIGLVLAVLFAPQLGWAQSPGWNWGFGFGYPFSGGRSGSGNVVSEAREVHDFDEIAVRYPAEVFIQQGDEESLSIEAEDNLLPQLDTLVRSGRLTIRNNERRWSGRVTPTEPVRISITVRELREIEYSTAGSVVVESLSGERLVVTLNGAGDIKLHDLALESLNARINGAGNIGADGAADLVEIRIDGLGRFNGENLQSLNAKLEINGAGAAGLRVVNTLDAEINGAGSIGYYGSPEVQREVNGLGSVNRLGD